MADELGWPIEVIPDADSVLMRAHRALFLSGELAPGVFRSHDGGMSVNWDKYSSPELTKSQATRNPDDNAVIRIQVVGIRRISDLRVEHSPEPANRAHSDVCGLPANKEQLTEVRVLLLRITVIAIPLAPQ
jgi:hypothetical protein